MDWLKEGNLASRFVPRVKIGNLREKDVKKEMIIKI